MMAAVQAIMRFKKLRGFYADVEDERHSVYVTHTNEIHNRYGQTDLATTAKSPDPRDDHEPEVAA
jgi:hypothetical protein